MELNVRFLYRTVYLEDCGPSDYHANLIPLNWVEKLN
jgi:hypothetical protein